MREIGVGVIGWGFMGQTHTHALRAIPMFYQNLTFIPKLAAVCSRDADKAARARELFGFRFSTGDYRELLARPDVEVVSVCTPNGLHEVMAVDALRAGKHLYIDKPLSTDAASARRILEASRGAKGLAQMVFHNRFYPATMRAKQLIGEGAIGEVLCFSCRYLHSGSIDPNRPYGWKQGPEGGVMLDLGSHALDLVTWLIGAPASGLCATYTLYGTRPTRDGGSRSDIAEDQALITLKMPNGALGTIEASKIATGESDVLTLEIRGLKGALRWNLMDPNWLDYYDNTLPERPLGGMRGFTRIECVGRYPAPGGAFLPSKNTIGWDRAHIHCYCSFLECVANEKTASPSLADGVRVQEMMEALMASSRSGEWRAL